MEYSPLSNDVISRALKAKTYSKQQFNQTTYTPGSLIAIDIPSLPQFWVPSMSWFQWDLIVNYTSNNLDATSGGAGSNSGSILVSQLFPHCAIIRSNVISSNGQSISNIQGYAQIHMIKVLQSSMDMNVNRMNLININPNWFPYAADLSARASPYTMGTFQQGVPTQRNIVATGTGNCTLTINTQFGMLPIFSLDSLIDLASMASQTRSAMRLEFQMDIQTNWLTTVTTGTQTGGGSGAGVPTLVINSVQIRPTYTMCLLQPTVQLAAAVAKLINSNNFLIPITSYLTQPSVISGNQKATTIRAYVDEEDLSASYIVHQLSTANYPFQAAWDAPNNFTHAHVTAIQLQSGGAYFPSYGPIVRSDLATAAGIGLNNFDAIEFQRHFLNCKTDVGERMGTMITPAFYNSCLAEPNIVTNSLAQSANPSVDFVVAYSFESGTAGMFSGFNVRANGGTYDTQITYNPAVAVPNCNVQVFSEYGRVYALTTGGLIYLTYDQVLAKLSTMSPNAQELLDKILHISSAQ